MTYAARIIVGICLSTALLAGCATPSDQREGAYLTYQDALSACRQKQPGRASRKFTLPSTHPHVAECLKRHGWNTDGTRRVPDDSLQTSE